MNMLALSIISLLYLPTLGAAAAKIKPRSDKPLSNSMPNTPVSRRAGSAIRRLDTSSPGGVRRQELPDSTNGSSCSPHSSPEHIKTGEDESRSTQISPRVVPQEARQCRSADVSPVRPRSSHQDTDQQTVLAALAQMRAQSPRRRIHSEQDTALPSFNSEPAHRASHRPQVAMSPTLRTPTEQASPSDSLSARRRAQLQRSRSSDIQARMKAKSLLSESAQQLYAEESSPPTSPETASIQASPPQEQDMKGIDRTSATPYVATPESRQAAEKETLYQRMRDKQKGGSAILIRARSEGSKTSLIEAVQAQNLALFQKNFAHASRADKIEALSLAASHRHAQIFDWLVGQGDCLPILNERAKSGQTPLINAIVNRHYSRYTTLLQKGAHTDIQDHEGRTALHHAVIESDIAAISTLFKHNANPNAPDNAGKTPLHYATTREIYELLVSNGAHLDHRDSSGSTPWNNHTATKLHQAVLEKNDTEIRKHLAQSDMLNQKNENGDTALHLAVRTRYPLGLKLLLQKNPDLSAQNNREETALHVAVQQAHWGFYVELLSAMNPDQRAKVLACKDEEGHCPRFKGTTNDLHRAAQQGSVGTEECKRLVRENNELSNPLYPDEDGNNALMYAITSHNQELWEFILSQSVATATFNLQTTHIQARDAMLALGNKDGDTALHLAAAAGNRDNLTGAELEHYLKLCESLIQRGCQIAVTNNLGNTPLHRAAHSRLYDLLYCKKDGNACLRIKNLQGDTPWGNHNKTPLHTTISRGLTIDAQTHQPSDLFVQDPWGNLPLHYAINRGDVEACTALLALPGSLEDKARQVTASNNEGNTPLHTAVSQKLSNTVALILTCGADITKRNEIGQTALHGAAHAGTDIQQKLLAHVPDAHLQSILEIQDNDGNTALQHAILAEDTTYAEQLITKGAAISQINKAGQTALDCAVDAAQLSLVISLEKRIARRKDCTPQEGSKACELAYGSCVKAYAKYLETGKPEDFDTQLAIYQVLIPYEDPQLKPFHTRFLNAAKAQLKNHGAFPWVAALKYGKETCKFLIEQGAPTSADSKGNFPLHYAAAKGESKLCEPFGTQHLEAKNKDGNTPLHLALEHGHLECALYLIELAQRGKNDLTIRNNHDDSPMTLATRLALFECMKKLAPHSCVGYPLHEAALRGDVAAYQESLARGETVSDKNLDGDTPVHFAVLFNQTEILKLVNDWFSHHKQAADDFEQNFRNKGNYTPCDYAVYMRSYKIVKALLEAGIEERYPVIGNVYLGEEDLMKINLDNMSNLQQRIGAVKQTNSRGDTPLIVAAALGKLSMVRLLLRHGAPRTVINHRGETALYHAVFRNDEQVTSALLCKQSDADTSFLKDQIRLNTTTTDGNTPLHLALKKYKEHAFRIVSILLEHGGLAALFIKDAQNMTPFDYAVQLAKSSDAKDPIYEGDADTYQGIGDGFEDEDPYASIPIIRTCKGKFIQALIEALHSDRTAMTQKIEHARKEARQAGFDESVQELTELLAPARK